MSVEPNITSWLLGSLGLGPGTELRPRFVFEGPGSLAVTTWLWGPRVVGGSPSTFSISEVPPAGPVARWGAARVGTGLVILGTGSSSLSTTGGLSQSFF